MRSRYVSGLRQRLPAPTRRSPHTLESLRCPAGYKRTALATVGRKHRSNKYQTPWMARAFALSRSVKCSWLAHAMCPAPSTCAAPEEEWRHWSLAANTFASRQCGMAKPRPFGITHVTVAPPIVPLFSTTRRPPNRCASHSMFSKPWPCCA